MASPGKRRRKKAGNPAPVVVEIAKVVPVAKPKTAPKTKKKKKGFFNKD